MALGWWFAVVFFAAAGALAKGLTGGVETGGDDAAEAAFGAKTLAVEREEFGEQVAVFGEPGVEGAVAGHGKSRRCRLKPLVKPGGSQ